MPYPANKGKMLPRCMARRRRVMEMISQPGFKPSLREMAEIFGVGLSTIRNDVDVLRNMGYIAPAARRNGKRQLTPLVAFVVIDGAVDEPASGRG
jgi:hypothetical protein